jgi:glyoxylase-like metal-dependent hydrolase (beta-lactamase superfamily II)
MDIRKIEEGFWRWTAPHPAWVPAKDRPGGWGQYVGCVYFEAPARDGGGIVLVDPLAPPDGTAEARRFWEALDRDVARVGRPIDIVLGNHYHARDARKFLERYHERPGAELWVPEAAVELMEFKPTRSFAADALLPGGLKAYRIEGLDCPGETVFHIPSRRALVCADALIGVGGGRLRVPPEAWAEDSPQGKKRYKTVFRESLRSLAGLDIDRILVSHGEPAYEKGRAALLEAVAAPAWGDA